MRPPRRTRGKARTPFAVPPGALAKWLTLADAVDNYSDRVPCLKGDRGPAIAQCAAYADAANEPRYVWAGVDRTPPLDR